MSAQPGTVAAERLEAGDERRRLTDYRLALGDRVEVELLGARLVMGNVAAATPAVLVLEDPYVGTTRIPWGAVATIRTPDTTHPANQ